MFLTLEDPRAKIQGSRDPLGVQPIWASFGRHLVYNLTTITTSIREFTVLLLGRYLSQWLIEEGFASEEDAVPIFLRFEQIAGYARHVIHGADDIRGINRVQRFRNEQGAQVRVSTESKHLILSDQRSYGVWGLYSVSGRASGFLDDGPIGVTDRTRRFIESHYLPILRPHLAKLRKLLLKDGRLDTHTGRQPVTAVGDIFSPNLSIAEQQFYSECLRDAQHVSGDKVVPGRQALLAKLLVQNVGEEYTIGRPEIRKMAESSSDSGLANQLRLIDRLEAVLAPAEEIFLLAIARNNQRPRDVARELTDLWGKDVPFVGTGFESIQALIVETGGPEIAELIGRCDQALAQGDYQELIEALLDWNKIVMEYRGAAPWIRLSPSGHLDVRFRGKERALADRNQLYELWRNSYFLDSLYSISRELEENHG